MPEKELTEKLVKVMREVRKTVPMGFSHRNQNDFKGEVESLLCFQNTINDYGDINPYLSPDSLFLAAKEQIGTLGGGNHFCEIQKDKTGQLYIMVHSGSRNLGYNVCDIFNKQALSFCQKYYSPIPNKDLAFLPTDTREGVAYIHLMNICQLFAELNREIMGKLIYEAFVSIFSSKDNPLYVFLSQKINVHHNYASLEHFYGKDCWIHRKGAICAREGMLGVIPGSMGTSSYIVKGKGNNKSWNSCSHGAGRTMSRKKARETFTVDQFKEKMNGIVFHCDAEHIDESPMAYKNIDEVMEQQKELVSIETELKPLAAEKA
ncbi:MAG: RtcB family protein [Patescibacteria group bacterium]|jgi:tRNA-splicing ligase RtcB